MLLCIASIFSVAAQNKKVTLEQAVRYSLMPETLWQTQWRNNKTVTYVKDYSLLFEYNVKTKKATEIFSTKKINSILEKNKIEALPYFPTFKWKNENVISFKSKDKYIILDISKEEILKTIPIDEKAENINFNSENSNIAYTIDNNLFTNNINNKKKQITNDTDKNFVNGQSVSRNEFGIDGGIFWSPKGSFLAFFRKDESAVTDYPLVNVTTPIASVENTKYPMAGTPSEHVCLGVYNIKTDKTIFIEKDEKSEKYLTCISWGSEEKYIYIAVLNREQNHMKLNKYDVSNGKLIKTLFEEKHPKYVEADHKLTFLKTKKNQFIWQSERDGYNHLYLYDTEGKLLKQITKGDWIVTELNGFDTKEKNVFITTTKDSPIDRTFYKVNIKSGKMQKLTPDDGMHKISLSPDAKYFIDNYSSQKVPSVSNIVTTKGKKVSTIFEAENPTKDYKLGECKIGKIKTKDGKTDLYYRLIKPTNFNPNKKYPAIVYVYGGPHAQLITNIWNGVANMWFYYLAQEGYVILTVDNRGSAGRGRDFENVIHRKCGVAEMEDQMQGIELLKSLNYVDMNKIGVDGWSYGGFMTISLKLKYPEIFKVGVAGGPVIDWKYYEAMYGERYMDTPQENPEGYKNASLLNKVEQLQGRLMIIHGAIDPTVVWQNSLAFVRECVKKGKQLDYFAYPRHKHNVRGTDRVHLLQKITQYFNDFLR